MTMDDNSSVYVGGLAFDSSEAMLRSVFEAYGDILAIKIIYDKESGQSRGFGFVTFTNPRAALDAIHEMDGGLIGGRIVRVNEVKKITARSMANNREGGGNRETLFQRDREKERDREQSDKEKDNTRNKSTPTISSPQPQTTSPTNHRKRPKTPPRHSKRSPRRGCSTSNYSSPARKRSRSPFSSPSQHSSEHLLKLETTTDASLRGHKRSSKQRLASLDKTKEELDVVIKCREDLERKVAKLECTLETKDQILHQLQAKTKKFEGRLEDVKTAIIQRKKQMRKLRDGVLQLQSLNQSLKASEKEFKILATTFATDLETEDVGELVGHEDSELGMFQGTIGHNVNTNKKCEAQMTLNEIKNSQEPSNVRE